MARMGQDLSPVSSGSTNTLHTLERARDSLREADILLMGGRDQMAGRSLRGTDLANVMGLVPPMIPTTDTHGSQERGGLGLHPKLAPSPTLPTQQALTHTQVQSSVSMGAAVPPH